MDALIAVRARLSVDRKSAFKLDETRDVGDALIVAQIGEDEGPRAAHALASFSITASDAPT